MLTRAQAPGPADPCGRCRVMPAQDGQAWCADCTENDDPGLHFGGVHASQLDPSEVRDLGCSCPAGGLHTSTCAVMVAF